MVASAISRRQSNDILMSDVAARRLSEAGVNRRPSAALVLTEDTDSFKIGDSVFVDGIKPGRIQFIGKNGLLSFFSINYPLSKSVIFFSKCFPLI